MYSLTNERLEELSHTDESQQYSGDLVAVLAAELLQLREQVRWIPVEERLPEKRGKYYWCSLRDANVTIWENLVYFLMSGKWDTLSTVTHWMPLPSAPKRGE